GEHGRLVARSGPDLEHPRPAAELQRLAHEPHDVGLRDRLLGADRQRRVVVSPPAPRVRDEEVPGHAPDRIQYGLVRDAARRELLGDHLRALASEVYGHGSWSARSASNDL